MKSEELILRFPQLFHMAEEKTWDSIQRHGLLSTSALLDRFEINGAERATIESHHRPNCVTITHRDCGTAVIRDQKPMSDKALEKCLDGMTPSEWYQLLNRRVFFWVSKERLVTLLQARAYRNRTHCVLTIDTSCLVNRYFEKISLSPINSGCTVPNPQRRGRRTFLPIDQYPYDDWRKKRGNKDPVVELAVEYAVSDIAEFTLEVSHMQGNTVTGTLFKKEIHGAGCVDSLQGRGKRTFARDDCVESR